MRLENNIVIGTEVNTDGVEKGVVDIERITDNLKDIKIEVDDKDLMQGYADQLEKLINEHKELTSGPAMFESDLQKAEAIKLQVQEIARQIEKITGDKLIIKGFTDVDTKTSNIENRLKSMNNSLEKVGKKISRIGLKLLGINSIYGMISSSVKRVQDDNPQFATFMQAIQNMLDVVISKLMTMIEPFLPKLLPLIEKVLTLIFEIVEAFDSSLGPVLDSIIEAISWIVDAFGGIIDRLLSLLGIDISTQTEKFAKDISEASKGIKKANKEVSKLRKQLLGFDEMNILNKDGSIGGLGTTTGGTTTGGTGPGGRDDSKKTGKSIGKAIIDSALGMLGKSNVIAKVTRKINKATVSSSFGIPILSLLFGKDEDGIIGDVQKVLKSCIGIFNLFGKRAGDEFNNFSVAYKNGMVEVTTSTGQVVKMTEQQYKDMMKKLGINANETFDLIKGGVVGVQGAFKNTANENKKSWFDTATSIILKYTGKGQDAVKGAIESAFNNIKDTSKKDSDDTKTNWFNSANSIIAKYIGKTNDGVVDAITSGLNAIPKSVETNTKSSLDIANDMINKFKPASKKVNIIATLDTSKMMATLKKMASSWPMAFEPIVKALQKQGFAKGGIVSIPRLASGGIINKPGRGVPLAVGGIAGERGREAVLPLTDSQQMAYLGREIAKNIVVNLTNITELDGRQIAIATSKAINEMNFASNGGVI